MLVDSLSKKRDGIYKKAIPIILQKSMLNAYSDAIRHWIPIESAT